jgi:hypothetical protein
VAEAGVKIITAPALLRWRFLSEQKGDGWRLLSEWHPTAVSVALSQVPQSMTGAVVAEVALVGAGALLVKTPRRFHPVEVFDDLRLRRGRPPEYDRADIVAVAEEAIRDHRGVDDHLDWFIERVRNLLATRHIKAPKDTLLTEICAPIYKAAQK